MFCTKTKFTTRCRPRNGGITKATLLSYQDIRVLQLLLQTYFAKVSVAVTSCKQICCFVASFRNLNGPARSITNSLIPLSLCIVDYLSLAFNTALNRHNDENSSQQKESDAMMHLANHCVCLVPSHATRRAFYVL